MKYIYVFFFVFLLACDNKKASEVTLFNGISFGLKNGEIVDIIDSETKSVYNKCFNNQSIQIPLFKCITHQSYKIFIAVPFKSSIEKLINRDMGVNSICTHNLNCNSPYYFRKYIKDSSYITEYAILFDKKSLIFASTVTSNKEISDLLLNKSEIIKRFKLR